MVWYDGHRVALAGEDLPGAGALHHRHHVPPLLPHPRRVPRQLGVRGHPAALRMAGTGGGGRKCERLPNVLARPAAVYYGGSTAVLTRPCYFCQTKILFELQHILIAILDKVGWSEVMFLDSSGAAGSGLLEMVR